MSKRPLCDRCEVLPRRLEGDLSLYLSTPVVATREKLVRALRQEGLSVEEEAEVMQVSVDSERLDEMAGRIAEQLSRVELGDTRALLMPSETTASIADLIHMETLDSVLARIDARVVHDVLENNRLVTYVHPIVCADDTTEVYAYECLSRGTADDGSIINPGFLFDTARKADLLFYLDREARVTSIRSGARLAKKSKLFINFNPSTIYTPEYCLNTTMRELDNAGLSADDVVFEVVESDRIADVDHLLGILDFYRERGFKVALDDLGAGFNSLTTLSQLRPDYMKLDIDLVRDVDRDPFKEAIVRSLLTLAKDLGIHAIAEGIEREGEYLWVKNAGAAYLQGYYFSKPVPAESVAAGD